ncbi:MAG: CoA-transferase [Candidatus Bathyarchaeia archaeon]
MWTIDELMVVCMAREVEDGDIIAQGLTTPMAIVAYYLAKATHAPEASIMQLAGNILIHFEDPPQASIMYNEYRAMEYAVHICAQTEVYETIFKRANSIVEFFRPAQIDKFGNTNNSLIKTGGIVKLPGGFGIPDASPLYRKTLIYCPRHERRVFVDKVDHVGGLGLNVETPTIGERQIRIISEFGVFRADREAGQMRMVSIHPGVEVEDVVANTGFGLFIPERIPETPPPTSVELKLIREKIDPLNIRRLEFLSGNDRVEALLGVLEEEVHIRR